MKLLNILVLLFVSYSTLLSNGDLKKVSIQLLWKHQFEFAAYYIAKEKGFYKDAGLDVEIKEFKFGTNIVKDVLEGKSTFGVGYSSIISNKLNGNNIVLLNALLQTSPHVLVSLKSSNINKIEDFKNRSIQITEDEINSVSLKAMLHSNKIFLQDMNRQNHTYNINKLIDKKVDITSVYLSNELYILDKLGMKYNIWNPKNYGFEFYDDFLYTSNDFLNNNTNIVNKFNNVTLKAWEYAFSHIDETVKLILEKYNTQNKSYDALKYEANVLKNLAYKDNINLGNIDSKKIQKIIDIYNVISFSNNKIDVDDFIYDNEKKLFNIQELKYIKNKKRITMCIDPNWMPYEQIKNGKHIGISADYFKEFKKIIPIKIELIKTKSWSQSVELAKEKKCDILSLLMETQTRKKYFNFTKPYLSTPLVIATKLNSSFINNFKKIKDKKIGIPKGYALIEIFKKKYPYLNIIEVKNIDDGLNLVKEGKLFGYVGTLTSIGYNIQKNYISTLKIAGKFDEKLDLRIGVRNDDKILLSIFNKAINKIDLITKQQILNHWINIQYDKKDYKIFLYLVIFLFVIVALFFYKQIKLKKELKEFDQLLDMTVEAMIITKDRICINVNQSAVNMFSYKNKEEMKNCNVLEFAAKESHETIINNIKTHKLKEYQAIGVTKENKKFPIQVYINQLKDKGISIVSIFDLSIIKEQEKALSEQAKLVSMGEMIGNIAHQWRQPLSVISTSATTLQVQNELGLMKKDDIKKYCISINKNAQYLSKTIDDFRNFIKGDRVKNNFSIQSNLDSFLHLIEGTIKSNNIKIITTVEENIKINGYENELIQCYINIINNSKDALISNDVKEKLIFINIYKNNSRVVIEIKDNAGGVPLEIMPKIFDPYFTTKHQSQGTGIGLNMTYKLITDGMNGKIEVYNETYTYEDIKYKGANFKITLPI